jgi:hypothetical protein
MPKWLKIVLLVLGALVLMCGIGVTGVSYWFNKHKDELKLEGEAVMNDARAFAKNSDQAGCLTETLARLKKHSGFMEEVQHRIFLAECLRDASETKGFCDDVPGRGEIMQTALWANGKCGDYDGPKEACGRMMQELVQFCSKRGEPQKP